MSIRFAESAKRAFSFLEDAGFRLKHHELSRLHYETEQVFLTVEWDRRSGELNVFVGPQPTKGEPPDPISLRDLLSTMGVNEPEAKTPFQVAEEHRLGPFLDKLAEDTRVHAGPALAGDRMFFRWLRTSRTARAQAHTQEIEIRRIRGEAEMAWRKRELDKLIDLYASIEDHLTASERAKLSYARRHRAQ
jgi:hypothetical protein